jgi:hypothetical protein
MLPVYKAVLTYQHSAHGRKNWKHLFPGRRREHLKNLSQRQMEVHRMNKPNFQSMNQKELQSYVLAHREDQEAFYAYVDKLHVEGNWIDMPPMRSEQDFDNYPEFIEHIQRGSNPQNNTV